MSILPILNSALTFNLCLFGIVLLLRKKGPFAKVNQLFGLFLVVTAYVHLILILFSTGLIKDFVHFALTDVPVLLTIPVVFFYFSAKFLKADYPVKQRLKYDLILPGLSLLYYSPFYFQDSASKLAWIDHFLNNEFGLDITIVRAVFYASMIYYLFTSYQLYRKSKQLVMPVRASFIKWFNYIIVTILLLNAYPLFINNQVTNFLYIPLISSIVYIFVLVYVLRNTTLFGAESFSGGYGKQFSAIDLSPTVVELDSFEDKNNLHLDTNDLIYVKSFGNYVRLFIRNDGRVEVLTKRGTLANLKTELSSFEQFVQVHRSYLINSDYVEYFKGNSHGYTVRMEGVTSLLKVSRSYVSAFRSIIE